MNATSSAVILPALNASQAIPENVPFRESQPQKADESTQILEVSFNNTNTHLRESLNKPPRKPRNIERRSREYLTEAEIEKLVKGAESVGRHGFRDGTLIFLAYRHGLRVSELVALRWDQIDMVKGLMHVNRRKNGTASTHPIRGPELRALRRLQREYPGSAYVFNGERHGPLTDSGVRKIVVRAGKAAGLEFPVHVHMLRHACGYKLANDGQDTRAIQHYLGHKNITHTVRYTELSPERFKDFWQD
jgi:type 1 fimbriae regulatory protein FimB/type 1 fimbriae regulatory protein FimE